MISTSIFTIQTLLYLVGFTVAVITVLYLLKLRKRRIEVPFSPIWKSVLTTNVETHRWKRHLRRILSWLFFLLISLLILFAIYDPHFADEATQRRHVLILVDVSASMSSKDVSAAADRLDLGKKQIVQQLKSYDSQDRIMLATFGDVVQPQTPFVSEVSVIQSALNQLQPLATSTNFHDALSFAAETLSRQPNSELILVTDGASPDFSSILDSTPIELTFDSTKEDTTNDVLTNPSDADSTTTSDESPNTTTKDNEPSPQEDAKANPSDKTQTANSASKSAPSTTPRTKTFGELLKDTTIRFVGVGESHDNVAITAFNARRYVANRLDFELLVQVQSYFDREIEVAIDLHANNKLVDTKTIKLGPNQSYQQFYPSQAVNGERLMAHVRVITNDAQDIFPMDNYAYSVLPKKEPLDVLLVTSGNLYVEGPLLLNPNIKLKKVNPREYQSLTNETLDKYRVIILDGVIEKTPVNANVLYINPTGENSPWTSRGGDIVDPIIARVKKNHPLLRWLSLQDLNIQRGSKLVRSKGDDVVAAAVDGTPMIIARTEPHRRIAALAFDVRESDFPLRVAFPVFMINVLDWFTADEDTLSTSFHTGDTWKIAVPQGVTAVKVIPPKPYESDQNQVLSHEGTEGSQGEFPPSNPNQAPLNTDEAERKDEIFPVFNQEAYIYGTQIGFYQIINAELAPPFRAVVAANLSSRAESNVKPHDLTLPPAFQESQLTLLSARQTPWVWLILVAFALLLIEWFTYNRRITE